MPDFISEFTTPIEEEDEVTHQLHWWKLFVDGASNDHDSGAGVILITSEGRWIRFALRLDFKVTNNEAKYETMIIGLKLAREISINEICIYSNSQLVVN